MPYAPPYNLANLLQGDVRWAYTTGAPAVGNAVTKIDDIMAMTTPYALKTGWTAGGATSDSTSYELEMDEEGREIQQASSEVHKRINSVQRRIVVPMAEINAASWQLAEAAPASTAIAAGAVASGTPAQTRVDGGNITALPRKRHALIVQRDPTDAPGEGGARGRFVAIVLQSAALAIEGSEAEFDRADGTTREVTFEGFPDPLITDLEKSVISLIEETGLTVP